MKKLLVAAIMVAFAAAVSFAATEPTDVTFECKNGNVAFNHTAHKAKSSDCTECHHKGLEAGSCKSCHGVDPAAPKAKNAYHKQCKDCHKKNGISTKCGDCHKK